MNDKEIEIMMKTFDETVERIEKRNNLIRLYLWAKEKGFTEEELQFIIDALKEQCNPQS